MWRANPLRAGTNQRGILRASVNQATHEEKGAEEKGDSLEESDNLPDPDVLAQEIVEDLEAAVEQFREIAAAQNDLWPGLYTLIIEKRADRSGAKLFERPSNQTLRKVNLLYTYTLLIVLSAAYVSGCSSSVFWKDSRSERGNLADIDHTKECDAPCEFDYENESRVFSDLEERSERYLKHGMSKAEVEKAFGKPRGGVASWNDVRFGNPVTMWRYALSVSGTTGFYVIFVNDRLDFFGAAPG